VLWDRPFSGKGLSEKELRSVSFRSLPDEEAWKTASDPGSNLSLSNKRRKAFANAFSPKSKG
jgi:hypothetical protein